MTRRRKDNAKLMLLQFLADQEQRIARQKELIAELRQQGRPTAQAEAELQQQLLQLAMLRNHSEIAQELMAEQKPRSARSV